MEAGSGIKEGWAAARIGRRLIQMLSGKGLSVYRNEQVPGNDGGIALGQAYLAGILLSRQDGVEI